MSQPSDLRGRIVEALKTTPAHGYARHPRPEVGPIEEWRVHGRHNYDDSCALCRGEVESLADAILTAVKPDLGLLAHATEFTFRPEVPELDGVFSDDALRRFEVKVGYRLGGSWFISDSEASYWDAGNGREPGWAYHLTAYTLNEALAQIPQVLESQAAAARTTLGPIAARIRERREREAAGS